MAFYGKEYELVKSDDNFAAYAKSVGIPADLEEHLINSTPIRKIEKNGDTYTHTIKFREVVYTASFKPGVESLDVWGELQHKSTYFVDGNTITHVKERNGKKYTIKSVFTDNDLVETVSSTDFKGEANRYFKAVEK